MVGANATVEQIPTFPGAERSLTVMGGRVVEEECRLLFEDSTLILASRNSDSCFEAFHEVRHRVVTPVVVPDGFKIIIFLGDCVLDILVPTVPALHFSIELAFGLRKIVVDAQANRRRTSSLNKESLAVDNAPMGLDYFGEGWMNHSFH